MKLILHGTPNSRQREFFLSRARHTAYGGARGGGARLCQKPHLRDQERDERQRRLYGRAAREDADAARRRGHAPQEHGRGRPGRA